MLPLIKPLSDGCPTLSCTCCPSIRGQIFLNWLLWQRGAQSGLELDDSASACLSPINQRHGFPLAQPPSNL